MIDNSVDQLLRDEGVRYIAYQDSRGFWTLGAGHNLNVPISHDAVMRILRDDISIATAECLQLPFWFALSEARQGALLNLTFNQGIGWVGKNPKMVDALTLGDYATAATELLDGPYKDQVGARAYRLAKQIAENVWV